MKSTSDLKPNTSNFSSKLEMFVFSPLLLIEGKVKSPVFLFFSNNIELLLSKIIPIIVFVFLVIVSTSV